MQRAGCAISAGKGEVCAPEIGAVCGSGKVRNMIKAKNVSSLLLQAVAFLHGKEVKNHMLYVLAHMNFHYFHLLHVKIVV